MILTSVQDNNLSSGLLSYHKLDGNSNDSYGTNNGTDTSVSYVAGKLNSCADFTLTSSKITIPLAGYTSIVNAATLSAWVMKDDTADVIFIIKYNSGIGGMFYFESVTNKFVARTMGGNGTVTALSNYSTGTWYHLCLVWRVGIDLSFYINGALQGTSAATSAIVNTGTFDIGKYVSSNAIDGKIDEVGVWNRALSSTEVSQLYGSGTPPSFDTFRTNKVFKNGTKILKN